MKYFTFILLSFLIVKSYAQIQNNDSVTIARDTIVKTEEGNLTVYQNERLTKLLEIQKNKSKRQPYFDGYRIQVFSCHSTLKYKAEIIRDSVRRLFPKHRVYMSLDLPDFKVRIGNFRNKYDAYKMLLEVKKHFPYAWKVRTKIKFTDFYKLDTLNRSVDSLNIEGNVLNLDSIQNSNIKQQND